MSPYNQRWPPWALWLKCWSTESAFPMVGPSHRNQLNSSTWAPRCRNKLLNPPSGASLLGPLLTASLPGIDPLGVLTKMMWINMLKWMINATGRWLQLRLISIDFDLPKQTGSKRSLHSTGCTESSGEHWHYNCMEAVYDGFYLCKLQMQLNHFSYS